MNAPYKYDIVGSFLRDKEIKRAIDLSEKYDEVFFAVGIHPYDIDEYIVFFQI